ncbi:hypothetical protein NP233_g10843 [Leucocoprinus birnbaumii]|uniref:Uncharacterized protein n=1 Tax=Leucocoprinus birnbaumii TaxID=56174 RepID=A0AAD5YRH7_9AGAR|nr:hypothetical protein NP233_g10843 [Leucocoprinus birnbaumii]
MEPQPPENKKPDSALPHASQDPAHRPSVLASSLPRSFLSCKSRSTARTSLHGLSALGRIPKDSVAPQRPVVPGAPSFSRHDLSMLILSLFSEEATAKLGHSGYADTPEPSSRRQSADLRNMFSTTSGAADERPARKLKRENKIYNFLTRSRSRSQSQTDLSPPENPDSIPQVPENGHVKQTSGSKLPHRIPSRPISSTTTATNTTITPGTPKVKKKPTSSIPVPSSSSRHPRAPDTDARKPRPPTPPQSTNPRRKINIFGISITRPSRGSSKSPSRSRSRPSTPRLSVDIPPLPTFGFEEDPRGQPSQSSSRAASPQPTGARGDLAATLSLSSLHGHDPPNQSKESCDDSHVGSSKLRGFFAGKESSRSRHQTSTAVAPNLVSAPVKRVPSFKRRSLNKALPDRPQSPPADPRPSSPPVKLGSNSDMVPLITTTPASPIRAATVSGGTTRSANPSSGRTRFGFRNRSLDTGYRYQGTMDVVDEEGRLSRESRDMKGALLPRSVGSKGKEKESTENTTPRASVSRMSTSVRSTKHGSFDFERPGLGASAMQRSASGGTTSTVTSAWSRSGETLTMRDSALGPGLAGLGTTQRDVSVKRGKEREEKAKEIKRQAKEASQKKVVVVEDPAMAAPKTNPSPAHSSNGHQTPPSGTTSGKSSSLSKASARRIFEKRDSSSGNKATTQHGLFSFESPIPSPNWSTTSASTTREGVSSSGGRTDKEAQRPTRKDRAKEPKERSLERKHSQKRDRSPVPVPKLPTFVTGVRSGVKGRSLDLNLGLAWAPTKVREDALLKSSSLFNRSMSNSSGSRSANSSAHGHETTGSRSGDMSEEKLKLGREIGELFRKALGEARYTRFKTYIYQFDAHEIPFDGPTGIVSKVDSLLATVPTLGLDEKRKLMDKLVRIILQNA